MTLEAVLFDLDGTLLDTHQDMATALNVLLIRHARDPLPIPTIRPFVSKGAMVMVCLAFRCKPDTDQAKSLWEEYLDIYQENICHHTRYFDGMEEILNSIESAGRTWGIVTNKPAIYTEKLLKALNMWDRPGFVVSGDTLPEKKPDPAPLLYCAENLGVNPKSCVYIGDDERDVIAGTRAGMTTVAAAYGYIVVEENPKDWNSDFIAEDCKAIYDWILPQLESRN